MNRRDFLVVAVAAGAAPAAFAQQRPRRIGLLSTNPPQFAADLRAELEKLGRKPNVDIVVEQRHTLGGVDELRKKAREIIAGDVEVMVTYGTSALIAAKAETTRIPIVGVSITDPVGLGIVDKLARPIANVTGIGNRGEEIGLKRIELLRTIAPVKRLGYFINPDSEGNKRALEKARSGIAAMHIELVELRVAVPAELDGSLQRALAAQVDGIHVPLDGLFTENRARLIDFALAHRLPSIGGYREFAEAGGLASYGQDPRDMMRIAAGYVDRLLRGARIHDLPFQRADKIELCLNLKTANALSIRIPREILGRADVVIE